MSELIYAKNGDYLIPGLSLSEQEAQPLGKYGRMRKNYLKEHRPATYSRLRLEGTLKQHLLEVDAEAKQMVEAQIGALEKAYPAPDKAADPLAWAGHMNSLKAQAEEIVRSTLIYA